MFEAGARVRKIIPEETMLSRLAQSEQMRDFFIQMWMENPGLAKQGGIKVKNLMTKLEGNAPRADNNQSSVLCPLSSERGISLIELIMFIMIVSVALVGVLIVMNTTTRGSADPLIRKQALAIAESLLEEVELMPFTFCDPDDVNAASAGSSAGCTGGTNGANDESKLPLAAEGVEARGSTTPYDNVSDYNGFSMTGAAMQDIAGNSLAGLGGYTASVVVGTAGCAGIAFPDALSITVTVTGLGSSIVLDGCRTRYSPRGVP